MPHQRCSLPTTWNVKRQGGINVADEIKVANQRTLKRKIILNYLGQKNVIKGFFKVEEGSKSGHQRFEDAMLLA